MIQRIQSIYLLLAAVACIVCSCLQIGTFQVDGATMSEFNLWIADANGAKNYISAPLFVIQVFALILCLYTIFIYSNRKLQARFTLFSIMLLIGWYVVFVALMFTIPSTGFDIEWPAYLPLAAIVLCKMAHRGILHDERLVRAADRIR